MAVAEALLRRSVCCSAGAGGGGDGGAGEGSAEWGEGVAGGDLAGKGGEWTRAGDAGACRGPLGAALSLTGLTHHPLCPSASGRGLT